MLKVPMTPEGKLQLEQEFKQLKNFERVKIAGQIANAREMGDLKENAEYHAAREQQSLIEGRIQELESKLSNAQVIDVKVLPKNDRVVFGCTVELVNLSNKEAQRFQIVGEDEADYTKQKISITSPVARSLIGKQKGDEAIVTLPTSEVVYQIKEVSYQ